MFELAVGSVLALAIGCKGCDDAAPPAATAEPEPEPAGEEKLKDRLTALNLELTKTYPARADGVVDCGSDKTCFLAMLERCAPALLDHAATEPAGLLVKKVHSRYRIEGEKGDSCALQRLVIEADVALPEEARKSLADNGRDDMEIGMMLAEARLLLRSHMPPRVTCVFTRNRALELGLDMVEGKPFDAHFQEPCDLVGEEDVWPHDLTPPRGAEAQPQPNAAPQPVAEPERAAE